MTAAGLVNFGTYCKDPCFVKLSQTIVSYTRTLIPHCNAVLKMYSEELYYPIIDSISELLRIIINVLTDAMRNVRDDDKSKCWCFSGSRHFSGNRQQFRNNFTAVRESFFLKLTIFRNMQVSRIVFKSRKFLIYFFSRKSGETKCQVFRDRTDPICSIADQGAH